MGRVVFIGESSGAAGGIERLGRAVMDLVGAEQFEVLSPGVARTAWPQQLVRDRQKLRQLRPEIVVADRLFYGPYAIAVTELLRPRPRMVMWIYGSEVASRRSQRWKRAVLRRYDALVCISRFTQRLVEEQFDDAQIRQRLVLSVPGVDAGYWESLADQSAPTTGAGEGLAVLSVGRITTNSIHKGMDRVAAAVGRLRRRGVNVSLTVVGDGPHAQALDRFATIACSGAYVRHAAPTDAELAAHYRTADVMALPSMPTAYRDRTFVEGFGLVFLEAAACGTPSIGGEASGAIDAVAPGRSGRLVQGSVASIAAALEKAAQGDLGGTADTCRQWARENDWQSRRASLEQALFEHAGRAS